MAGRVTLLLLLIASPAWALTVQDTFTRTENPLASGWADMAITSTAPFRANGTDAQGTSATLDHHVLYTASAFGAAQFSRVVIGTPGGGEGGPAVRSSVGSFSGYFIALASPPSNVFHVRKGTGGPDRGSSINLADGTFAGAAAPGDVYELSVTGTSPVVLRVTRNGVAGTITSGSLTDSTAPLYTTGSPGMFVWQDGMTFASWTGGDLDLTPPGAPSGVTASGLSTSQIQLGWSAGSGATAYFIEQSSGATCTGFTRIGSSPTTTFTVSGLSALTTRCFRVQSTNGLVESGYSNEASGTTFGTENANLAWNDANTSPNEQGTELWCCEGSGCTPGNGVLVTTVAPNVTTASYVTAPLPIVTCAVRAVSTAQGVLNSGFSATWANTPTAGAAPAAPTGLTVTPE